MIQGSVIWEKAVEEMRGQKKGNGMERVTRIKEEEAGEKKGREKLLWSVAADTNSRV